MHFCQYFCFLTVPYFWGDKRVLLECRDEDLEACSESLAANNFWQSTKKNQDAAAQGSDARIGLGSLWWQLLRRSLGEVERQSHKRLGEVFFFTGLVFWASPIVF